MMLPAVVYLLQQLRCCWGPNTGPKALCSRCYSSFSCCSYVPDSSGPTGPTISATSSITSSSTTIRAIISNNTIDSTIDNKTKYLFGLGLNKLVVGWGRHKLVEIKEK